MVGREAAPHTGPRKVAAMPDDRPLHVLRGVLIRLRSHAWERDRWDTSRTHAARDLALTRYDQILAPERVGGLDRGTFLACLRCLNAQHTLGLGRGIAMAADMPHLREALALLVDERLPLRARLDRLRPHGGEPMVKGLGPSVITAFLHFVDPDRYGILNGASERVMRRLIAVGRWIGGGTLDVRVVIGRAGGEVQDLHAQFGAELQELKRLRQVGFDRIALVDAKGIAIGEAMRKILWNPRPQFAGLRARGVGFEGNEIECAQQ